MSQKKIILAIIGIFCILGVWIFFGKAVIFEDVTYRTATVHTENESLIAVRIADTDVLRRKGLSGTVSLSENEGMLFEFLKSDYYGIWMKDMLIPIDIVWLDENFTVIHREINISPETYPQTFISNDPAKYVLEISADSADEKGLFIGSKVVIQE